MEYGRGDDIRRSESKHWWTSLPAVLTAIATLIGAVTTFLALGPNLGWWGSKSEVRVEADKDGRGDTAVSEERRRKLNPESSTGETQSVSTVNANRQDSGKPYEVVASVGEAHAFVDPETGFVFAVEEITDWGNITGVFSQYTLPDGTSKGPLRWKVGHRVDFESQGRRFFMVIENIDYKKKAARIRIRSFQ